MNLFTRNSPYYHLLKYLILLLKHPVYISNNLTVDMCRRSYFNFRFVFISVPFLVLRREVEKKFEVFDGGYRIRCNRSVPDSRQNVVLLVSKSSLSILRSVTYLIQLTFIILRHTRWILKSINP
jgi:formyltetrahydrofolate hydrolase